MPLENSRPHPHDSTAWLALSGRIVAGHQVASGRAADSPYPRGTIAMQIPHFQARGLDLSQMFPATLNVSIAPYVPRLSQPEITFAQVKWSPPHPAETFSFSPCQLEAQGQRYSGWIYYPHPETKPAHFQDPSTLEVLAPQIPTLAYGDAVRLFLSPQAFEVSPPSSDPA